MSISVCDTTHNPEHINPTVKHSSGSMFSGGGGKLVKVDGKMDGAKCGVMVQEKAVKTYTKTVVTVTATKGGSIMHAGHIFRFICPKCSENTYHFPFYSQLCTSLSFINHLKS
ncbi:hypothetical protein AMECASPLE_036361 [Ameca splendens]|uniref:Uncharacterized protein n=1 Tax=Ameca splendens TaxID=208324 RepID=A0ABV0XX32_9TELE